MKLHSAGNADYVHSFLRDKDVILLSTAFQEIRKRPDLLSNLEDTLATANPYLVSDVTRFWYADIFNFLNVDGVRFNSLETYPLLAGFIDKLIGNTEFENACATAEKEVSDLFLEQIEPDVGADLDERDLCVVIWDRVNKYSKEFFRIGIPPADCHAHNFPAFFVHYYTYYYRYIKNATAVPELNDFIDLANSIAAPYCSHYYCEQKFANVLRNSVQGRQPPSPWRIIKNSYRKGIVGREVYEDAKRKRDHLDRRSHLLPGTKIFSYSEMKNQILNGKNA